VATKLHLTPPVNAKGFGVFLWISVTNYRPPLQEVLVAREILKIYIVRNEAGEVERNIKMILTLLPILHEAVFVC